MLVLTRKDGEGICIGDEIVITVLSTSGGQVRLGIEAPTRITIHREEVYDKIAAANRQATNLPPLPLPQASTPTPGLPLVAARITPQTPTTEPAE